MDIYQKIDAALGVIAVLVENHWYKQDYLGKNVSNWSGSK